ncbi:hypothetical protein PBRA_007831 [Plasmodiophora brassicae]|nr:hypothetical protein PBRA_007831 [Plasmodiophora brassicae]
MSRAAASVVVVVVVVMAALAMAADSPTRGQGDAASEEAREMKHKLAQKVEAKERRLEEIHKAIDEIDLDGFTRDHKRQLKATTSLEEFIKVIDSFPKQTEMETPGDETDEGDEEREPVRLITGEIRDRLVDMYEEVEKLKREIVDTALRGQEKESRGTGEESDNEEGTSIPVTVPGAGSSNGKTTTPGKKAEASHVQEKEAPGGPDPKTMSGSAMTMGAAPVVATAAIAGTVGLYAYKKKSSLKKGWNKAIAYLGKSLSKVPAGPVPSPEPRSTPMTVGKVAGAVAATTAAAGAGTIGYFAYTENDLAKGWNKAVEKAKNVANAGLQTLGLQEKPAQTPPEVDQATSSATGAIVSVGAVVACAFAALA